ncbi:uncharacterized protein LOC114524506 isoform X2 [Dendronephthya gigantea]|uniref:uncharacterized protein LOC114524506 isoform X2 n=1 Tax=Dendronephthya gigantea TaxID=151771 RepID=UPI00106BED3A|nr:uncharacterized protein LOC114524506 isoform X2 [Dendronephthya gigantea]
MDSDDDEELSLEENIRQWPDHHGGKLNEILSEVETKIPSLEFDDDDNEEVISVWSPPKNVPSFYKQFTSCIPAKDKQITAIQSSSVSGQTDDDLLDSQNEAPVATPLATVSYQKDSDLTYFDDTTPPNTDKTTPSVNINQSLQELDCSKSFNVSHTDGCSDAFNTEHPIVLMKTSSCQTSNNELSDTHEVEISTALDGKVVNPSAPNDEQVSKNCSSSHHDNIPTVKLRQKVDTQISTSVSCQTEHNYSVYIKLDESKQTVDPVGKNIQPDEAIQMPLPAEQKESHSSTKNDAEYKNQLDFDLLKEINFSELQLVLGTLPSKNELSVSDLLPSTSQQSDKIMHSAGDAELMSKLSDLSKDQLSACTSVMDSSCQIIAESFYQTKRKVKCNYGSAKSIHTWSQLSSDDNSSQEPQTVFLDLRPEGNLEKEKEEEAYSESIQRILGLKKERLDSNSDEESDDEHTEWREMRMKLKERAKRQPEERTKSDHSSKVIREPFLQQISSATVEKLDEKELTGGLPVEEHSEYCENSISKEIDAKSIVKSELEESPCLNVKDGRVSSRSEDVTEQADASMSLGCKIGVNVLQDDRCQSEEKEQKIIIGPKITKDENFAYANLNKEELKSQNDYLSGKIEKDEWFFETHAEPSTTHANIASKKNDPLDNKHHIAHDEKGIRPTTQSQQFDDEKDQNSSRSVAFRSGNTRRIQRDEKTASSGGKSEEFKETNTNDLCSSKMSESVQLVIQQRSDEISTVEVGINLRFSGTEEGANDDTKNMRIGSLPKEKEQQCGIYEKRELSNDVLVVDPCNVYRIIECMNEKTSKQSLTTETYRTITPTILEKKEANKNKLDKFSKPQKERSQKELKKLKEKLKLNIERMRPTVTASGKYPAACNTPIIYDQDASFQPHQQGLLLTLEGQLSLLLVVTLTGCGEINHQYSKGNGLASGAEVNQYYALISWLCYLCNPHSEDKSVPFTVVGIHQAYQNGQLQLFVGVQPNGKVYDPNITKGSTKNKTRAFNKAISKYLSTHSLRSVYQKIENVYLNGCCQVDEDAYSSKMLSTYITVGQDLNAVRRVFKSKSCFYWETIELEGSNDCYQDYSPCDVIVENTVVFLRAPLYYHPSCVLDLLTRIENDGCDVAGLRLTTEHDPSSNVPDDNGKDEIPQSRYDLQPTLNLAVRGPFAIAKMKKIIGSKIPLLDDRREIPSLRAIYCSTNTEDKSFYCPSYVNQATAHLARVFGGRLTEDDIRAVEDSNDKPKPCSPDSVPAQKPPAFLVTSTRVAFILIISPLVPPSFLGELLHTCFLRGFVLHGIRRVQLSKRQGTSLGFSQLLMNVFCPSAGNTPVQSPSGSPPGSPARRNSNISLEAMLAFTKTNRSNPSTILILQHENGLYHAASLVKHIFESLKDWMTTNSTSLPDLEETTLRMYLTIAQFNDASSKSLWGDVCYKPDTSLLKRARNNRFSLNSEAEQICVLSSVNQEAIQIIGILLKKLTNSNSIAGDWELLGIKSFPSLSLVQSREVTPHEVGDSSWLDSIKLLMSNPVVVCVFRGINIIQRLRDFMISLAKEDSCIHNEWTLSLTSEVAFRQLTVLFEESELFPDDSNRTNTVFVPPLRQMLQSFAQKETNASFQKKRRKVFGHKTRSTTDDSSSSVETARYIEVPIIQSLLFGPRPLPTIALIKPYCVANTKKIGKIFKSFLQENFDIVALNMRVLTQSEAQVLVRNDESDYNEHIQYLTSSTSLVICLQRENAVKKLLDILGPEDPIIARSLDPFLLRGCYGVDSIHNAIHGSESYSSAICELKMLFPCGVCCGPSVDLEAEQIPCRAFDETIGKKTGRKMIKNFTTTTAQNLINCLVQVNCVILTHHILYGRNDRKRIALVDVLEFFLSANFVPVGMKMTMLSREQVNEFFMLIGPRADRKHLENELSEGPCIILALQRDNAITCFDSIIESVERKRRSITEHREHIIHAETENEAKNLLIYFFDELAANSVQQISQV